MDKVGIIITFHNRIKEAILPCLTSVLKHTPDPRYVLVYNNQSSDPDLPLVEQMCGASGIELIHIHDQVSHGGLTGTWNKGIDRCQDQGCKKIILLNHDAVVDESWPDFILAIQDDHCIYGPITNEAAFGCDYGSEKQNNSKEYTLAHRGVVTREHELSGFCLGFTIGALASNKFDKEHYFDPRLFFCYNELEWQERWRGKGRRTILVHGAFVFHHQFSDWKKRSGWDWPVFLFKLRKDFARALYLATKMGDSICHRFGIYKGARGEGDCRKTRS